MTEHVLRSEAYPLRETWEGVRADLAAAEEAPPTGEAYLDVAETIVRAAAPWVDELGAVIDPYVHHETSTCTPRFVGALGQLIGAGRCADLVDLCALTYETALDRISNPYVAPEFYIKELVLAHRALRERAERGRVEKGKKRWRAYHPDASYAVLFHGRDNNFSTFGLVGEFLRLKEGLGGRIEFVDELLEKELTHVDAYGLYHDPGCPLVYHAVVIQQWSLLLMNGYEGRHHDLVTEAVRRGGLTSLLMQSCVGQAPFGGRSNQFLHNEAQNAAMFEACARLAKEEGDDVLAGAYKRAARRNVALIRPWVLEMAPFRHIKQEFHPELNHGTDSGGLYGVYGILTASLCGIAHGLADESIEERMTPAERGGFAFSIAPEFSKVFAGCAGWSVEIDTRANMTKDATGLGRVQRIGLRPEAILAGSIAAEPEYTFAFALPQRNAAIGPEWVSVAGRVHRLADFSEALREAELAVERAGPDRVAFEVTYTGVMGGADQVREHYVLDSEGLRYWAEVTPVQKEVRYVVPIIETDGDVESTVAEEGHRLVVAYRGGSFTVAAEAGTIALSDERNTNRNATYRTAVARADEGERLTLRIS